MTDRDRLVGLLDWIVECERLRHYHSCRGEPAAAEAWAEKLRTARSEVTALLDPPPPQPAGPVTFEADAIRSEGGVYCHVRDMIDATQGWRGVRRVQVTVEPYGGGSKLLTPAEVERRARGWWQGGRGGFPELVAALTRGEGGGR